jgi:F-type H+-transporting ATPase subunit gamma
MKSYLEYKNHIQGFSDVSETVKTVEKISASSVHYLKQKVVFLNTYTAEVEKVLSRLALFHRGACHPLLRKKRKGRKALVILTGDKGLVGGLWHGVVGVLLGNIEQYQDGSIVVVGSKGGSYLKEEGIAIEKVFAQFSDIPRNEEAKRVTDYIFGKFTSGIFSQVDILYPRFISLAEQTPGFLPFLPFEFKLAEGRNEGAGLPIFEPSGPKVFGNLLQKYIGISFYKVVMETKLSEFSARTVAMEHAAAKTEELIRELALSYAKERHRFITQRQIESFTAHKASRLAGNPI